MLSALEIGYAWHFLSSRLYFHFSCVCESDFLATFLSHTPKTPADEIAKPVFSPAFFFFLMRIKVVAKNSGVTGVFWNTIWTHHIRPHWFIQVHP